MRRRDFIKAAFVPATAWPLSAWAQKAKKPVIGLLGSTSADAYASRVASVRKGLSEAGFVEGQNVTINPAGPTAITSDYRRWPQTWFVQRWT